MIVRAVAASIQYLDGYTEAVTLPHTLTLMVGLICAYMFNCVLHGQLTVIQPLGMRSGESDRPPLSGPGGMLV
jgi:hypothetical protein